MKGWPFTYLWASAAMVAIFAMSRWADISRAGAIIEIRNRNLIQADASQGSHFFQHITARGLQYITITEDSEDFIDWAWLEKAPMAAETQYLRHIHLDAPLLLKADGRRGHCAGLLPTDCGAEA